MIGRLKELLPKVKELSDLLVLVNQFKATTSPANSEAHIILNTLIEKITSIVKIDEATETPFTKREIEILHLVAKGFTNKEIASAFSLSPKTIEFHLKNIYKKSDSSNRSETISLAISNGWITP